MRAVDPRELTPGARLPQNLFSRSGVKLLAAGTVLTDSMSRTLAGSHHEGIFFANSVEELAEGLLLEPAERPRVGVTVTSDLISAGGVVAIEAGQVVEDHHAEALEAGAYKLAHTRETRRARARRMRLADDAVAECATSWERVPLRVEPGEPALDVSATGGEWPTASRLAAFRDDRVRGYRRILSRLLAGLPTSAADPLTLVDELIDKLCACPQRFTQLALCTPRAHDYLPDHAYTTACLSVAIAARLGWGRPDVRLVGLAGLLADVGMALVPKEVRSAERALTEIETNRIYRHPAQGVVLLESMQELPEAVRLAVFQHHERENGAGYPRALRGPRIHDYAKVISVADAFAAATEPRPYRRRKRPYDAIEQLIQMGAQKLYERKVVRCLVECTGLFPVGSFVRLNTGQTAHVIGAHAAWIDRPIVSVVSRRSGDRDTGKVLDLAEHKPWELHVVSAVDDPYIMWTAA